MSIPPRTPLFIALVAALAVALAADHVRPMAPAEPTGEAPFVVVLGVAQDAGYPQAGCRKACCREAWKDGSKRRFAASLAIVDPKTQQRWLIDCTPDFPGQLRLLDETAAVDASPGLNGVLLTHAHIGHYAGLVHLGREVISAKSVPVFAMPRMRYFLESNGPWEQLVKLNQIKIRRMSSGEPFALNDRIRVTPFLVPHRDEYSETVGFRIEGPNRSAVYVPDIDKWDRWKTRIESLITKADLAFLDGTFYADGELPGRDISKIPHPFVSESMSRFSALPTEEREKIHFIHLNHTNPLLRADSKARRAIRKAGYHVAKQGERHEL